MASTVIELTTEQKIQILEKGKELLGPNGENWTKACFWGVKYTDAERKERLIDYGYDPTALTDEEFAGIDDDLGYELSRWEADPENANVWCLMGALEEAAYRLGIVEERDPSERLAEPISLRQLLNSKNEFMHWNVIDVNDRAETTFGTIRGLIDERLAQLREQP